MGPRAGSHSNSDNHNQVNWPAHMSMSKLTLPDFHPRLYVPNPTWLPPDPMPQHLAQYIQHTTQLLARVTGAYHDNSASNISHSDRLFLASLSNDRRYTVCHGDKNYGIAIVDTATYMALCREHVHPPTYVPVPDCIDSSLLIHMLCLARDTLVNTRVPGLVPHSVMRFLCGSVTEEAARIAPLYGILKLHKPVLSVRPIASCCSYPTTPPSTLLATLLQPHLQLLPTVLRDTASLVLTLEHMEFDRSKHITLLTFDVVNLYPSIPMEQGLIALQHFLCSIVHATFDERDYVLRLARFVLDNHYILFDSHIYHQRVGTAMGTPFAPQYSQIYMWHTVDLVLTRTLRSTYMALFKRFIDDGLVVLYGPPDTFLDALNRTAPGVLAFTHHYGTRVDFLDTSISLGVRFRTSGKLDIELFQKANPHIPYVPYRSSHPRSVFASIPMCELSRYRLICTSEQAFLRAARKLFLALRVRGYPEWLLNNVFSRFSYADRPAVLARFEAKRRGEAIHNSRTPATPFVTRYSALWSRVSLSALLRYHWHFIAEDPRLYLYIGQPVCGYTNEPNLARILIHTSTSTNEQ